MADALLHAGIEHPNVTWIAVGSLVTLVIGLVLGLFADRIRALFGGNPEVDSVRE